MSELISPEECKELYRIVCEDFAAQYKNQFDFVANSLGAKSTDFKASLEENGDLRMSFRASFDIYSKPNE